LSDLISIVIPCFNSANYLQRAVDSCLSQSYKNVEIILVDDGSIDETNRIIKSINRGRHPDTAGKVSFNCLFQDNQGVSAARNYGALNATGEWLIFLDSDDELLENALKTFMITAKSTNAGVVYGDVIKNIDGKRMLQKVTPMVDSLEGKVKSQFGRVRIMGPGSAMVLHDLHNSIGGFDTRFSNAEDRDYFLRCSTLMSFQHCNSTVLLKNDRENSAAHNLNKWIIDGMKVQLKFLQWSRANGINTSFIGLKSYDILKMTIGKTLRRGSVFILPNIFWQFYKFKKSLRRVLGVQGSSE